MVFKISRLTFIVFTSSYFIGILWLIFVCDLQSQPIPEDGPAFQDNFCISYIKGDYTNADILMKVWYYAITTLSTVGFGDFHPITALEQFVAIFILMGGVMTFSLIMAQFLEIFTGYRDLWNTGYHHKDLNKWVALLARFNNGQNLSPKLV